MRDIETFLDDLARWAASRGDVVGVALVGSYARGAARPDSDVDVVILCEDPRRYIEDRTWVEHFGVAASPALEDYKMVQSLRTTYPGGLEVEFGMTVPAWASTDRLDAGTRQVVADGCRIVFDKVGVLGALVRAVASTND